MAFQRRIGGFTLIELMIVVAVIAILAAIAYPSYLQQVIKSRRATGAACLMEMAQAMERHYTTTMAYTDAVLPGGCQDETDENYDYALTEHEATEFTIMATAKGSQLKDDLCKDMSIDQTGSKTVSGTASADPGQCF
jgi:type IV pilus assembly protein PilE